MHKKIMLVLAIALFLTPAIPSFAQFSMGDDLALFQHECNLMVIERLKEKEKFYNERQKKAIVNTKNYNCQNGYTDNKETKKEKEEFVLFSFARLVKNKLETGYDACVGFCKKAEKKAHSLTKSQEQKKKVSTTPKKQKKK